MNFAKLMILKISFMKCNFVYDLFYRITHEHFLLKLNCLSAAFSLRINCIRRLNPMVFSERKIDEFYADDFPFGRLRLMKAPTRIKFSSLQIQYIQFSNYNLSHENFYKIFCDSSEKNKYPFKRYEQIKKNGLI